MMIHQCKKHLPCGWKIQVWWRGRRSMSTWEGYKNRGATYVGVTEANQSCSSWTLHPSKYAGQNDCRDWYHPSTVGMRTGPEVDSWTSPWRTTTERGTLKLCKKEHETDEHAREPSMRTIAGTSEKKTISVATEERHGRHWRASGIHHLVGVGERAIIIRQEKERGWEQNSSNKHLGPVIAFFCQNSILQKQKWSCYKTRYFRSGNLTFNPVTLDLRAVRTLAICLCWSLPSSVF